MAGGPAPYNKRNKEERAHFASIVFDLRVQGISFRAIDVITQDPDGPTSGERIPFSTARDMAREEAERRVDPKVDEWRVLSLERLEGVLRDHLALRNAHWDRALGDAETKPDDRAAFAVDRALSGVTKTVTEQAKIVGIYTTKIEAQVTEVTQADVELAELIREAKARNAIEEARIKDGNA